MKKVYWKRLLNKVGELSTREKTILTITMLVIVILTANSVVSAAISYNENSQRLINIRKADLEQLPSLLTRYQERKNRLDKLKSSFENSQLTFEQVMQELDRIVRKNIGDPKYDLKKSQAPEPLGTDFEKQAFTLNIPSITLKQFVSLLFELEHGKAPLFMGKVDLTAARNKTSFRAVLTVSSISKKRT